MEYFTTLTHLSSPTATIGYCGLKSMRLRHPFRDTFWLCNAFAAFSDTSNTWTCGKQQSSSLPSQEKQIKGSTGIVYAIRLKQQECWQHSTDQPHTKTEALANAAHSLRVLPPPQVHALIMLHKAKGKLYEGEQAWRSRVTAAKMVDEKGAHDTSPTLLPISKVSTACNKIL